jgi:hypothetical protein
VREKVGEEERSQGEEIGSEIQKEREGETDKQSERDMMRERDGCLH